MFEHDFSGFQARLTIQLHHTNMSMNCHIYDKFKHTDIIIEFPR